MSTPEQSAGRSLAAALDQLPAPCFLADAAGGILWANGPGKPLFGDDAAGPWEAALRAAIASGGAQHDPFDLSVMPSEGRQTAGARTIRVKAAEDTENPAVAWIGVALGAGSDGALESDRAFLLELGAYLRKEHDPEQVLDYVNRALGLRLGALRVGYGEIDADEAWLTLQADWTSGVESNAGRFPLASFGPGIVAENRAGRTFVSEDVTQDPRIGPEHLEAFTRWGVGALVAVPLVKQGRFTAVLSIQADAPRRWSAAELALMEDVAERTWEALQRARAEEQLLATQARQAFLLKLGDRLRTYAEAPDILREAVQLLARQLGVHRVGYAEMHMAADKLVVDVDWVSGPLQSIVGAYPLMSFGERNIMALAQGETVTICDVEASPFVDASNRPAFDAMGIRSAITVPLVKRDRLIAVLSVQHAAPREWTEAERRLVEEVAERTWSTVERAAAEASLRQSEERLRVAIEGAQLGTWDYDLQTLAGWWSPRTCEIFGIPYTGSIPPELRYSLVHPDDLERYLAEVDAAAFAGRPFSTEYRIVRPDGEIRWVVLRGVVTKDTAGEPARATGIALDTTDRNRAEADLARSREALHQSEKLTALGSLLAGVAHELNNPLAVVVAHAELLEEEAALTPFAADARTVRRAADRCARIVQTFLAMARERSPERAEVDVRTLIGTTLELAEYGLRTAGVAVETKVADGTPPVLGDPSQLEQVLANLVINAQHAMLESAGARRLTIEASEGAPGVVFLDISDTGGGVPAEHRSRIFEPFYTTKPPGSGTGIGLSYSLGVTQAHGGHLEMLTTSDDGTTFRLRLPAATTAASSPEDTSEGAPGASRSQRRALVVDDEPELAQTLARLLEKEGFLVSTAGSGRQACELLAAEDFHLVLSDLRMADLDGPGLFDWIEANRPALAARTGFVTGDTMGAASVRFLTRTGRPFLEKPFDRASVRSVVQALVEAV